MSESTHTARRLTRQRFGHHGWQASRLIGGMPPRRLRVVTQNVCMDPHLRAERALRLIRSIEEWQADVIALQEVTPFLLEALMAADVVRDHYELAVGSMEAGYGAALLSRSGFGHAEEVVLPSFMGRTAVVGVWSMRSFSIAIATVHLESTSAMREQRLRQLELLGASLGYHRCCVLAGDFNFDPRDPEERALPPGFRDAWAHLRDGQPGYTEDTRENELRWLAEGGTEKRVRYDRVLVRGAGFSIDWVDRVGTDPFWTARGRAWLSDHFGVLADLRWSLLDTEADR